MIFFLILNKLEYFNPLAFLVFEIIKLIKIGEFFFLTVPGWGDEILRFQLNIDPFQITSESVQLIALIGLNMFSTHNVSENSLKKFLRTRF